MKKKFNTTKSSRKCKVKPQQKITLYVFEELSPKRQKMPTVGKHMEKRDALYTTDENVIYCRHYGKQYR